METIDTIDMNTKIAVNLPHGELLAALYVMWDSFENAGMDFFLVKDTAKAAINDTWLKGDTISIGVRKLEWSSETKDILLAVFDNVPVEKKGETEDRIDYEYKGVTIHLYLYDDNPCLSALNSIDYEHERFHIPNMFELFEKDYDHD